MSSADFETIFTELDNNNDGEISFRELADGMRAKGYAGTDNELKTIFSAFDTNSDGKITKKEYTDCMNAAPKKVHERVFRKFDKDGSGFIDKTELDEIFREMGNPKEKWEIERLVKICDKNDDGKISYEEFIAEILGD